MKTHILAIILICSQFSSFSQKRFFAPSDSLNKNRVLITSLSWGIIYGGTLTGLNEMWYKNYSRSSFHFFNDLAEWNQVDKAGHCLTAYMESQWSTLAFEWAGVKHKKAAILGSLTGFSLQSTIEILDAFSSKWGFSIGDIAANTAGCAINLSQNLLWNEQRIRLKFSTSPVQYSEPEIKNRALDLFGGSLPEKILKDYNGQTYWLSINPSSFSKKKKFPAWLNIAIGYGADGMLGGFKNEWKSTGGQYISRPDILRCRQFYLAPDIDFSRLKTKSPFLKTLFEMADVIKFPSPALEYTNNKLVWHWLHF